MFFSLVAGATGMLLITELLQGAGLDSVAIADKANIDSSSIEIMAKSAAMATNTAVATGSALLENFLGNEGKFVLTSLGGGGIAGWAVGFTLKKLAKVLAIILGISFLSIQYLAYKKIVTVDWNKVQDVVDQQKLESASGELMSAMTYNLPFAGSFLIGFWLGFRKG